MISAVLYKARQDNRVVLLSLMRECAYQIFSTDLTVISFPRRNIFTSKRRKNCIYLAFGYIIPSDQYVKNKIVIREHKVFSKHLLLTLKPTAYGVKNEKIVSILSYLHTTVGIY